MHSIPWYDYEDYFSAFDMRALQTNMTLALLANIMTFVLYIVWFRIGRGKGAITYLTPGTNGFGG